MPTILYPDIPIALGVPPLLRNPIAGVLARTGALSLLRSVGIQLNVNEAVWGIFDQDGNAVFDFQTVVAFGIRNSAKVSDFPLEAGSFSSYNKVGSPFEARMRIMEASSLESREALVKALKTELDSTNLYSIVTPEGTYLNATLEDYDIRRESTNGANAIIADLLLREIRETASTQFASTNGSTAAPLPFEETRSVNGASSESFGQLRPLPPSASQLKFLTGIF